MDLARKFTSRKFLIALAAGIAVLQQSGLTGWQAGLAIAGIAVAYIMAEAHVDREGVLMKEPASAESTTSTTVNNILSTPAASTPAPGDAAKGDA